MTWILPLAVVALVASATADLVPQALAGNRRAIARLVSALMPVIRATVRQALRRMSHRRLGPYDGDDLSQEIWLLLIADEGRRLRAFDPTRSQSLEGYVAMVARTESTHLLRREQAARRGGAEQHTDLNHARAATEGGDPEARLIDRDLVARLRAHLHAELPDKGRLVFAHLYVDGRSPADTAALMRVNTQVVYNWQHKIRALLRARMAEVAADVG
ncbi:MAG: sigma-70 family RNA polymerase sigma factor [Myxococcales bacterium]|nr:sigma-70 family RNA polymerase sigma factor [Myxococcales bacterium]